MRNINLPPAPQPNSTPGVRRTSGGGQSPAPFTAAELLARDLGEQRWAVHGLIAEGVSLLAGKPKKGKSWLAIDMALSVAAGSTFLNIWQCDQGDVLYLALEDGMRRLRNRIEKLSFGEMDCHDRLHLQITWPRFGEGGVEAIQEWLDNHPGARLIIIDTLAKVKPAPRRGVSSYDEDYRSIEAIKKLADERGVAVLLITHTRKGSAEDCFDTVNATLGLTGGADTIMVLEALDGKDGDHLLNVTGRDVEQQAVRILFDGESTRWVPADRPPPTRLTRVEKDTLLVLLGRPLKPEDAAALLSISKNAMEARLSRMRSKGLVVSDLGTYTVAPNVVLD